MFKFFFAFMLISFSSFSWAQNYSTAKAPTPTRSSFLKEGFQVAVLKPSLTLEHDKVTYEEERPTLLNSAIGGSVGYAYLPVHQLGWTSNLSYIDLKDNFTNFGLVIVDGNLGTALNSFFNLKGGFNISRLSGGRGEWEFGLQASVGFQFNSILGIDFSYLETKQSGTIHGSKYDTSLKGGEVALLATF